MRALVVSNDHVGTAMAGPGIRAYRFAVELARDFDVTLLVPFATDLVDERLEIVHEGLWDPTLMTRRVRAFDVVVAQRLPVPTMRALAKLATRTIYDLDPGSLEQFAVDAREPETSSSGVMARLNSLMQDVALATGDAFVCASENQRDFWLGSLMGLRRVDHELYERDPTLRSLIDVVPFGLDPDPPVPGPALKGVVPGIGADDKVLLWPGGIWNWFDPLTVIRAVHELSRRRDDVRLYFLGLKHPNPDIQEMAMATEAVALAGELGVRDRSVFFNFGWMPFGERGRYLLDADLAVSAHFDNIETHFAFRTRFLDCLWAGLPLVTTVGDSLGDLIVGRGGGRSVGYGDVDGWVRALGELLDDAEELDHARAAVAALRPAFEWSTALAPLRRLAAGASGRRAPRSRTRALDAEYVWLRLQVGRELHGWVGAARRLGKRALTRLGHVGGRRRDLR